MAAIFAHDNRACDVDAGQPINVALQKKAGSSIQRSYQQIVLRAVLRHFADRHFHVGRGGRAKLAISTSLLTRIVGACVSLINVPVAVRYLGNEGYGLLIVVVSVVGWIQLSNMGLGLGLQNALTEQVALGNKKAQQELVSTTFFALLGIAVLLIVAAVVAFL